jgi:hypothetical protein
MSRVWWDNVVTVDALLGRWLGEVDRSVDEFFSDVLPLRVAEKEW